MRQNYANIGRQSICWTDFDIDIAGSNPKVSTCSNTLNDSFEGVMRLFEVSAPFNMCMSFQMVEHPSFFQMIKSAQPHSVLLFIFW